MRIRLTRKLADCLDGVDLSRHAVGDVFDLPGREACLLIAERWASPRERASDDPKPRTPAGGGPRFSRERLEAWPGQLRRRAEDRIREEARDSKAAIARPKRNRR
jgi:hypothetical protein